MFEISRGVANNIDCMKREHKNPRRTKNSSWLSGPLESPCHTTGLDDLNLPEKQSFSVPDSPARRILLDYTFWYSGKVIIQLWKLLET